jgi:maltokinase
MNRTVSGCAIMVLVEGLAGFAAASYATDTALLAELRAGWPAPDVPDGRRDGYQPIGGAAAEVVAAVRLTDRFGVALCADGEAFIAMPLVRDAAAGWRRAAPGDGLSAFVAGVPMASERPIGVDQTHDSVVVGERAIVKWFRRVGPGPSRAATLIGHLDAVGFSGIPAPLGSLTWRSPAGVELTFAQGDAFLRGARDGWEWCVEHVPDDPSIGGALGAITEQLHRALATPSHVIREPLGIASPADLCRWRDEALVTLADAVDLTDDSELRSYAPSMRSTIDALPVSEPVAVQPVHGDLHVGQVLDGPDGLAVIDFDGNPALAADHNALNQPRERDVAQMLMGIDHVGRTVQERTDGADGAAVDRWIGETRSLFLREVAPVDERLLAAFEVEQECRELVYAARFLPRWRYAPMAALRARYGR